MQLSTPCILVFLTTFILLSGCSSQPASQGALQPPSAQAPTVVPTRADIPVQLYPTPEPGRISDDHPMPIHWQLATVHVWSGGKGEVPSNKETELSKEFDFLLNELTTKCGKSRIGVANMVVIGSNFLNDEGIGIYLLTLMEEYNKIVPKPREWACSQWFSAYTQAAYAVTGTGLPTENSVRNTIQNTLR